MNLILGEAIEELKKIEKNSIDLVIIDPPYFIDKMGEDWDSEAIKQSQKKAGVIGGLPVGMKFDPNQGRQLQKFIGFVSKEIYRVLKPGGFYLCFSQARLVHRMAVGIEDNNFEIRDLLFWKRDSQPKAFSHNHFVKKMKISEEEKEQIIKSMENRKTPQIRQMVEPIILAQKPKDGTFVQNWIKWGVGFMDTSQTLDGGFPNSILDVKRDGKNINHPTVKPVILLEHLIKLYSKETDIVLDCFMGSGSTGVAAIKSNRDFIGIELNEEYFNIAKQRIEQLY